MCDCKLAIPGTFNVLVDSVSTMSVFSPEKHAVFCEFILPVNVNSCELRTRCIFQYYQDHYHMIWSPCHFNYYLFFCCITFNFQLTGHSSIDFSNQLQTWIHWRFYFSSFLSLAILLLLCLPSSAPKNSCLQSFWCFDDESYDSYDCILFFLVTSSFYSCSEQDSLRMTEKWKMLIL